MNKKQSKRQRDIKTKLMAAVCMLLVSSIMMVSTTYAWFTLSTAPEVTGITTAVGANGNLEMALMPLSGLTSDITADQGDSMMTQAVKLANVTWGNLVDISEDYGMDQIVLYPSELNVTAGREGAADKINMTGVLKTPEYGADGRIAELKANTFTGVYQTDGFYQTASETVNGEAKTYDAPMGVRGIGTISEMSPRELAFRLAMSSASTAANQAGGAASSALSKNGEGIARIALKHAMVKEGTTEEYNDADMQWLINMVDGLLGGNGKTGAISYIEEAMKQYILADLIQPATSDANYQTIVDAVKAEGVTVYAMAGGTVEGVTVADEYKTWITTLKGIKDNLTTVKTTLTDLVAEKDTFTWSEISSAMGTLIDTSKVVFNDNKTMQNILDSGETGMAEFGVAVLKDGLFMQMPNDSGIFERIAEFCGDYTASFTMYNVDTPIVQLPELEVTMVADTNQDPIYLTAARTAAGTFEGGSTSTSGSAITDFYGYIIDMAFRTNAANSWLQLQQEGVDRIYADGSNTNTQGHGANMTFTTADSTVFSVASMKNLMNAIKIVFFDPSAENEIVGYAKLDGENPVSEDATTVTWPLVMCDKEGNARTDAAAIQIMQLNQNEIHQLSVLVYLDGNQVDNADVSIGSMSMNGSMNLQFSSSANLVAMDYANLKSGDGGVNNGGAGEEDDDEPTATEVSVTSITDGYAAEAGFGTYGSMSGICAKITGADDAEVTDGVTVTIGGEDATYISGFGWVAEFDAAPEGGVAIVVTTA